MGDIGATKNRFTTDRPIQGQGQGQSASDHSAGRTLSQDDRERRDRLDAAIGIALLADQPTVTGHVSPALQQDTQPNNIGLTLLSQKPQLSRLQESAFPVKLEVNPTPLSVPGKTRPASRKGRQKTNSAKKGHEVAHQSSDRSSDKEFTMTHQAKPSNRRAKTGKRGNIKTSKQHNGAISTTEINTPNVDVKVETATGLEPNYTTIAQLTAAKPSGHEQWLYSLPGGATQFAVQTTNRVNTAAVPRPRMTAVHENRNIQHVQVNHARFHSLGLNERKNPVIFDMVANTLRPATVLASGPGRPLIEGATQGLRKEFPSQSVPLTVVTVPLPSATLSDAPQLAPYDLSVKKASGYNINEKTSHSKSVTQPPQGQNHPVWSSAMSSTVPPVNYVMSPTVGTPLSAITTLPQPPATASTVSKVSKPRKKRSGSGAARKKAENKTVMPNETPASSACNSTNVPSPSPSTATVGHRQLTTPSNITLQEHKPLSAAASSPVKLLSRSVSNMPVNNVTVTASKHQGIDISKLPPKKRKLYLQQQEEEESCKVSIQQPMDATNNAIPLTKPVESTASLTTLTSTTSTLTAPVPAASVSGSLPVVKRPSVAPCPPDSSQIQPQQQHNLQLIVQAKVQNINQQPLGGATVVTTESASPPPDGAAGGGIRVDPHRNLMMLQECQLALKADEDGDLPLHIAAVQENEMMVQQLIVMMRTVNESIDPYNKLRQTPLHLAVITGNPAIVCKLLEGGANPNIPDRRGQSAVHLAVDKRDMACLKPLLTQSTVPVDLNCKNYEGVSPLHLAVKREDIHMVNLILTRPGLDINIIDGKSGRTPLFHAAENNSQRICDMLLRNSANPNIQNYSGNTAVQAASGRGYSQIVALLVKHGADAYFKDAIVANTAQVKQALKDSIKHKHDARSDTVMTSRKHRSDAVMSRRGLKTTAMMSSSASTPAAAAMSPTEAVSNDVTMTASSQEPVQQTLRVLAPASDSASPTPSLASDEGNVTPRSPLSPLPLNPAVADIVLSQPGVLPTTGTSTPPPVSVLPPVHSPPSEDSNTS